MAFLSAPQAAALHATVLGGVMLKPDLYQHLRHIHPEHFAENPTGAGIWSAIEALAVTGTVPSLPEVWQYMGGDDYDSLQALTSYAHDHPSPSAIEAAHTLFTAEKAPESAQDAFHVEPEPDPLGDIPVEPPARARRGRGALSVVGTVAPDGSVTAKAPKPARQPSRTDRRAANLDAVMEIFESTYPNVVRYDVFHQMVFKSDGTEFTDADLLRLMRDIQRDWKDAGMDRLKRNVIEDAISIYSDNNRSNACTDWLNTLAYDGTPRLRTFCARYLGADDNEYTRAVGANFWKSIAARAYQPGCQVDSMMILQGSTGTGKSTAMQIIGGPWYCGVTERVTNKDFYVLMNGKLIVDFDELSNFRRADIDNIKQAITSRTDRFRRPYGRKGEDHPRRCVFTGSTNKAKYLSDPAGGRRFWPITCGTIDTVALRADRDQLFAEAVRRYKAHETWHVMPVQATLDEQEERYEAHPWEDIVADYLNTEGLTSVFVSTLLSKALDLRFIDHTTKNQQIVADALRRLGWHTDASHRKVIDGRRTRYWVKDKPTWPAK